MRKFIVVILLLTGISVALYFAFPREVKFILNPPTTIGILPFGEVPNEEVDSVKAAIVAMYSTEVVVLDRVQLPKEAFISVKSPRYRADSLLHWLADYCPDSLRMLVGLTSKDISTTKYEPGSDRKVIKKPESTYADFGIFGLGRVGGNACVVSSFRLGNGVSKNKFFIRLTRISCHEVGHVYGLHHCPNLKCLMNDANESIKTIDKSTGVLCDDCKGRI